MDETELIAKAQMRMFGQAAGLSRETFERQFDAIFDAPPERQEIGRRRQPRKHVCAMRNQTEKVSD